MATDGLVSGHGEWENIQDVIRRTFRRLFDGIGAFKEAQEQLQQHVQALKRRQMATDAGAATHSETLQAVVAATKDRDAALTELSRDLAQCAARVDDIAAVMPRKADVEPVAGLDLRVAALERHITSQARQVDAEELVAVQQRCERLEMELKNVKSSVASQVQYCTERVEGLVATTDKLGVDLEALSGDVIKLHRKANKATVSKQILEVATDVSAVVASTSHKKLGEEGDAPPVTLSRLAQWLQRLEDSQLHLTTTGEVVATCRSIFVSRDELLGSGKPGASSSRLDNSSLAARVASLRSYVDLHSAQLARVAEDTAQLRRDVLAPLIDATHDDPSSHASAVRHACSTALSAQTEASSARKRADAAASELTSIRMEMAAVQDSLSGLSSRGPPVSGPALSSAALSQTRADMAALRGKVATLEEDLRRSCEVTRHVSDRVDRLQDTAVHTQLRAGAAARASVPVPPLPSHAAGGSRTWGEAATATIYMTGRQGEALRDPGEPVAGGDVAHQLREIKAQVDRNIRRAAGMP